MIKNKLFYSEAVLNELQSDMRGRDETIDQREVIIRMDAIVNALAKEGFLENWKAGFFDSTDESYLTRFEWLTCTDPSNNSPSTVQIPANYMSGPKNVGIEQVYFKNDFSANTKKYFDPVIIKSFKDVSLYRNNMAGNLEGRISCYPRTGTLYFDRGGINTTYGQIGMALRIRDSSVISDTDLYPIPGDKEHFVIDACVQWFRTRLSGPQDLIKDNNLKT